MKRSSPVAATSRPPRDIDYTHCIGAWEQDPFSYFVINRMHVVDRPCHPHHGMYDGEHRQVGVTTRFPSPRRWKPTVQSVHAHGPSVLLPCLRARESAPSPSPRLYVCVSWARQAPPSDPRRRQDSQSYAHLHTPSPHHGTSLPDGCRPLTSCYSTYRHPLCPLHHRRKTRIGFLLGPLQRRSRPQADQEDRIAPATRPNWCAAAATGTEGRGGESTRWTGAKKGSPAGSIAGVEGAGDGG